MMHIKEPLLLIGKSSLCVALRLFHISESVGFFLVILCPSPV